MVTIAGGGIGGLTMANALLSVGIDFDLYEQAPVLTEVGAGIGLSRGALELLDMLDLGDEARARGRPIRNVYLAGKGLNVRRKMPSEYTGICIHRADLIDILQSRVPAERIHFSKRVAAVTIHRDSAELKFADGTARTSECVIAADGIHSAVRKALFPEREIRYIDQTIWRGISRVPVPDFLLDSYLEVWDQRLRFLAVPIADGATFWLAVKPALPGGQDDPGTVREELLKLFRDFHPVVGDLIRHSSGFLRDDMGDLGPPSRHSWYRDRVVFLGDAIHATTPNLAQGGCQAMEDAVCLARCLKASPSDLSAAYATYQRLREKKVEYVVNTSWQFGVAAHSRNPLRHHLFRALLEHAPAAFVARQERFLSDVGYLRQI